MYITDEERFVILLLAHPKFNVDFVEQWQSDTSDSCKPTVVQAELNGFMAAVRALAKSDFQHEIYQKIDEESKIKDIQMRVHKWNLDKSIEHKVLALLDDEDFLQSVYFRWEKSLTWIDNDDVYWSTCDEAIKEVLQQQANLNLHIEV